MDRLAFALVIVLAAALHGAEIPLDASCYEHYLGARSAQGDKASARRNKALLKEMFGGAQFDMAEVFGVLESRPGGDFTREDAILMERHFRKGKARCGTGSPQQRRVIALSERFLRPIAEKVGVVVGGVHSYAAEGYVKPADPAVLAKLEAFQDRKLGLMIHFGIYSQLGIHESWPLVDAEASWSRRLVDWSDGEAFKRQYLAMNRSFNPVRFQPDRWAETARRDGFRYVVFTTKHHDGFCMYDSKYSDYKVTAPECPFSKDPKADITRAVFDAFRAKGLSVSCYFSKPDWHHPDYWDGFGLGYRTDRMPSYEVEDNLGRWARYRAFVRNQILELIGGYGPIDCLWLDGGQVQRAFGLDIGIEEIVAEARRLQPGLIAVDRGVGNACENIITPEQTVPPAPLAVPWESCITMGTGFSYRYDDTFKSPRELVHLLIDVVAKGGNLALNVAPGPDGRLPLPAVERMDAMGAWLARNGKAIYGTRAQAPHRTGDWAFTRGKGGEVYAIRMWKGSERGVRSLSLPEGVAATRAVRLATGRASDVSAGCFSLADGDWPDEFADAFELK